jgi:hypothetical protein
METQEIQTLTSLLKEQEELIKKGIILVRGITVPIQEQSNEDLFQMLLQNYPQSVRRLEILYKRFSYLHKLQKKRILKFKKASNKVFEEARKRIMYQNRLFNRFFKKTLCHPMSPIFTSLEKRICLGVTIDLAAKKIAGKRKNPVIGPTARGYKLQQRYIDRRLASIKTLKEFYRELSSIHFEAPIRYSMLYEILCKKWAKTFETIGGKKVKRAFFRGKKIFETKKLRGNRTNLILYKKFFRKVNEYALRVVEEIPEDLVEDLGLKIVPVFSNKNIPAERCIRTLKEWSRKCRKHRHVILEFQNTIEKSHHGIYCSLSPPYELQDANFPGFSNFRTDDLFEFQLFLCFWSCFYDFSSFKALYQIR